MNYRDDREALRGRVRDLEQQLGEARREGEAQGREAAERRAKELEAKIGSVRGELDRMEAELRAMRGDRPKPSANRAALLALSAGAAGIGVSAFLVFGRSRPPPSPPPAVTAVPLPATEPAQPPKVPEPPKQAEPPRVEEPKSKATPVARSATARWRATVKSAVGEQVAVGSSCFIDAVIDTWATNTGVSELEVTCGKTVIYDSGESFDGVAQVGNDAVERLGKTDDKSTFTLQYSDLGTRTGRPQLDLDTNHREAVVFRDTIPRLRIELSVPVESEPTTPLSGPDQRLRRGARVTEVSGTTTLKANTNCILRAMPTGHQDACVAELTCGTTRVLTPATPVTCSYDGARPVNVTAAGPLELTMTDTAITLKGSTPKEWTALLTLDP